MLNLIKSGKSGRNYQVIEGTEINLKHFFIKSEDSLTSNIFERLFYLPANIFWEILTASMACKELNQLEAVLISVDFWPKWKFENGYKEADLFLRFEKFDLIIEAKRSDDEFTQHETQWKAEMEAYIQEFGEEKPCYVLAIGGIKKSDHETSKIPLNNGAFSVYKLRWSGIIHEIKKRIHVVERSKENIYNSELNILRDILLWFEIHGFHSGDLLNTLPQHLTISKSSLHQIGNQSRLSTLYYSTFPANLRNIKHMEL